MNTTLAIGTKVTYKNKTYIVTQSRYNAPICDGCDLYEECLSSKDNPMKVLNISSCSSVIRKDRNNIIFKEVCDTTITKKIAIPEGYEIDVDNSNLLTGTIIFKLKEKTLDDVFNKYNSNNKDFANKCSYVQQLFAIMNYYNDGWTPKEGDECYTFNYNLVDKDYTIYKTSNNREIITFKSKHDCKEVINNSNFRPIIDKVFGVESDK